MVGSISHDFRTPLNGLMSTLQAIDKSEITDEFYDKYIIPCFDCSDQLLCLSDDMLVFTSINLGKEYRMMFKKTNVKECMSSV